MGNQKSYKEVDLSQDDPQATDSGFLVSSFDIETLTNAERIELNALARKAQDELGRLHGPEVILETLDGPTPYRAGDRVIIRETIRDAGLHNGSVATVKRTQGSVLFVERRDGQTVPIDTRQFPGVQHGYAHTEYREQGSTRYAELHLVDQHVNQRSLVVGMTRHTHRYGMHYSAEAVGSFENLVQFGERSRDKVSLADFSVRDLVAEQREAQELQRERERQAEEQKREREAAERGYRREIIGDFVLAKPTVMHVDGQDYAVPAGRHAIVGEISIVDGELRRAGVVYQVQDNAASIVSLIDQRDLVRAYRDGKVEVHAAHQHMMAKVFLAHKHEQTVDISAAELERYRAQVRERDDAPKQSPRRRPGPLMVTTAAKGDRTNEQVTRQKTARWSRDLWPMMTGD
jgi:hypothetical protein